MKKELTKLQGLTRTLADHFKDSRLTTLSVLIQNLAFDCGNYTKDYELFKVMQQIKNYMGESHHTIQWIVDEVEMILMGHYCNED